MVSEIQKPDSVETLLGPPVRRERSVAARRAARLERGELEARIVSLLNRGVAVAEIAAREGLSLKRMRNLVREILAQRMPQPLAEFSCLIPKAPLTDSWRGFPRGEISESIGAGDSRHAISG